MAYHGKGSSILSTAHMETYNIKVTHGGSIHVCWKQRIETRMDKLPYHVVLTPDQARLGSWHMFS